MDLTQANHLRAYGVAFHSLQAEEKVNWLLNYRGGSFLIKDNQRLRLDARLLGVNFEEVGDAEVAAIRQTVAQENMDEVLLEKPPRIAVYSPPHMQPWDDAVTLALDLCRGALRRDLRRGGSVRPAERLRLAASSSRGFHRPVRKVLRQLRTGTLVSGTETFPRGTGRASWVTTTSGS